MQKTAAIYIHVPFCQSKCHYCSFVSLSGVEQPRMEKYLFQVKGELERYAELFADYQIVSIYFGGGTPSLLPSRAIPTLLTEIRKRFLLTEDCEITSEANPDSFTLALAENWVQAGVNRVSLGCQAMQDSLLRILGRRHTAEQAIQAIDTARHAGIHRINLDLIYGIPTQTILQWKESLHGLLDHGVEHLSAYALSIEQGTPMEALVQEGKLPHPDEDFVADCYEMIQPTVASYGLQAYEISNFAVPGQECRHNLVYWHNGVYLGCGPAAHGANDLDGWQRTRNTEDVALYLEQGPHMQVEKISRKEEMFETVMLETRLKQGLNLKAFEQRFGVSLAHVYPNAVETCLTNGWAKIENHHFVLTEKVWYLQNTVLQTFL